MEKNEYQCAVCKKIYKKEWTDAEAEKELKENFGEEFITEDCDLVCDDCYKKIMGWKNGIEQKKD